MHFHFCAARRRMNINLGAIWSDLFIAAAKQEDVTAILAGARAAANKHHHETLELCR